MTIQDQNSPQEQEQQLAKTAEHSASASTDNEPKLTWSISVARWMRKIGNSFGLDIDINRSIYKDELEQVPDWLQTLDHLWQKIARSFTLDPTPDFNPKPLEKPVYQDSVQNDTNAAEQQTAPPEVVAAAMQQAQEQATDETANQSPKEFINEQDIAYMSSLSQAALEKPTARSQWVVWVILLVVIWLISWANYAELDKIIRGEGKVVPSTKIQVIQNLEGGIVEEIFIHTGDSVKKGQTLLKLDNTQFSSSFDESQIKEAQLDAQADRLRAEAFGKALRAKKVSTNPRIQSLYDREYALYQARRKQHKTNDQIIVQQIEQKKLELREAQNQENQLKRSLSLLREEVSLTQPLVDQGIASQVDLLKLRREENDALSKLRAVQYSIPKLQSVIEEYRSKRIEAKELYMNEAHEELNLVMAEISQLEKSKLALEDRVRRTDVKSPVNGTVKQIFVNTIGGVVQPGSDIVEIVPDDDALVLETKILPADIGFIYKGLNAKVKFTAYDFAIYGGLDGTVTQISADTITDEEGNSFYIARIKTDRNHLGSPSAPLYLLPGMTASVDIIVGKHTLLDYLLKPIIKAKDLALRES